MAIADGEAVVVIVGRGATLSGGCDEGPVGGTIAASACASCGAVATMLAASGSSIAPAGGGAIDSIAVSSGIGGVADGSNVVATSPTLAAIIVLDTVVGGAIVHVGVATAGGNKIAIDVGGGGRKGGEVVDIGAGCDGRDWRDGCLDGAKGSVVVDHDRYS